MLAACLVALQFSTPAANAEQEIELICAASLGGSDGAYVVSVSATGISSVIALQFTVTYDPETVNCMAAEAGRAFSNTLPPMINTLRPGYIYIAWDALQPLQSDGELLRISFLLKSDADVEITVANDSDLIFSDETYQELPISIVGCVIGSPNPQATETPVATEVPTSSATKPKPEEQGERQTPTASVTVPTTTETPRADRSDVEKGGPAETDVYSRLTINTAEARIDVGETLALNVAENVTVIWVSNNESIATVSENGLVIGNAAGIANITAETENGLSFTSCTVVVGQPMEMPSEAETVIANEETNIAGEPVKESISKHADLTTAIIAFVGIAAIGCIAFWLFTKKSRRKERG